MNSVALGCNHGKKQLVIDLTRAMHGLRPKALLAFAVQRLAQLWNVPVLQAVGDTEHIYRHFRKRKQFTAKHDDFWLECQGEALPDGNFRLPIVPQVCRLEHLAPSKRAPYRRRYLMLEQLAQEISGCLAS